MALEDNIIILVDTNEPKEGHLGLFLKRFSWEWSNLYSGDYGLKGFSEEGNQMVIYERKTLSDLIGSIIPSTERGEDFNHEMERFRAFRSRGILVEACEPEIEAGNYRSALNPNAASSLIDKISARHGTQIYWCGDKEGAARRLERLVWLFALDITNQARKLGMDFRPRKFASKEKENDNG